MIFINLKKNSLSIPAIDRVPSRIETTIPMLFTLDLCQYQRILMKMFAMKEKNDGLYNKEITCDGSVWELNNLCNFICLLLTSIDHEGHKNSVNPMNHVLLRVSRVLSTISNNILHYSIWQLSISHQVPRCCKNSHLLRKEILL